RPPSPTMVTLILSLAPQMRVAAAAVAAPRKNLREVGLDILTRAPFTPVLYQATCLCQNRSTDDLPQNDGGANSFGRCPFRTVFSERNQPERHPRRNRDAGPGRIYRFGRHYFRYHILDSDWYFKKNRDHREGSRGA